MKPSVVVLCGGLGGTRFDWADTVRLLGPRHRTVVLERPGFGAAPFDATREPTVAAEAELILDSIGDADSVVLVGHSIASLYTEGFARLYPSRTARLVLLDAAIEGAPLGVVPRALRLTAARTLAHAAARTGVQRLAADVSRRLLTRASPPGGWDPDALSELRRIYRTSTYLEASLVEYSVFPDLKRELDHLRRRAPLPAVPITVAAAHTGRPTPWGRSWVRRQRAFASSLGAEFTVVRPSHHHIMIDRPDVVARLCS